MLIARNVSNLNREVELLTQDVQDLEKELEFSGSTRTSDDVMKELEELTEKSKTIRRDMKRIHTEIDMNNRKRQSVERALNESSQKLIRLENERDHKVGMQLQLDDIKEQRDSRRVEFEVRECTFCKQEVYSNPHACRDLKTVPSRWPKRFKQPRDDMMKLSKIGELLRKRHLPKSKRYPSLLSVCQTLIPTSESEYSDDAE